VRYGSELSVETRRAGKRGERIFATIDLDKLPAQPIPA
jgi:hypothetical protein